MPKAIFITIVSGLLLAGCEGGWNPAVIETPPKLAADLCNGYEGGPAPNAEQAPIVDEYRAGKITFNECMHRLRG